jgi:hypothetical protein
VEVLVQGILQHGLYSPGSPTLQGITRTSCNTKSILPNVNNFNILQIQNFFNNYLSRYRIRVKKKKSPEKRLSKKPPKILSATETAQKVSKFSNTLGGQPAKNGPKIPRSRGSSPNTPKSRWVSGKSRRGRACPQQIVTTRLLYYLQGSLAQLSRLQRI